MKRDGDDGVVKKIADLVEDKVIPEISDVNNHSDRTGTRITIELKRDAIPKVVLNKLYKHTPLQSTFGVNMVALVDGVHPRTLSLKQMLVHYIDHQKEVVTRRTKFELDRAEKRAHVLEGYLIALDNLDAVIALIRASDDTEGARLQLQERFGLSEIQAQAILEMRLRALTGLERRRIEQEHADLLERIAELREILADDDKLLALIKEELAEIRARFADRAPHRDRAGRGRDRSRAAHCRGGHGHLHDGKWLHQAPAVDDVPHPGPRRCRHHGDGSQGGRLHRAPVRRLDARLPVVLHDGRARCTG